VLRFLSSWGIEPASEIDAIGHYFEFTFPGKWKTKKRKAFKKEIKALVE
jgi:hypothetical protein